MIRILFLVLVLANLAFAAWHAWLSSPAYPTRPIRGAAPDIALYNEALPRPADAVAAGSGSGAAAGLSNCVSIGPFPNRIDVQDAQDILIAEGFNVNQRTAQGDVWLGYWVYLDAIATQAEAAAIVERLDEAGIGEAYVIADGNNGSIVSLGVFSERARSQQRFAEVEALGLAPVTTNRSQPGEVFWVDVSGRDGQPIDPEELPPIEVDPQLQFEECSGAGA